MNRRDQSHPERAGRASQSIAGSDLASVNTSNPTQSGASGRVTKELICCRTVAHFLGTAGVGSLRKGLSHGNGVYLPFSDVSSLLFLFHYSSPCARSPAHPLPPTLSLTGAASALLALKPYRVSVACSQVFADLDTKFSAFDLPQHRDQKKAAHHTVGPAADLAFSPGRAYVSFGFLSGTSMYPVASVAWTLLGCGLQVV